jgi:SAM-dependent methyltransferase
LILDVGCGNGKNLPACDEVGVGVGCDISSSLVGICRSRGFEVAVADAMTLPYEAPATTLSHDNIHRFFFLRVFLSRVASIKYAAV